MVATLGLTSAASYGVLSYAFAVFIVPMSSELGWSKATITGAFSIAQIVTGVAAIPIGRWVDRHGARGLMTVGAILGTLTLVAWSRVESVAQFYVVWMVIGIAAAAVFYEPGFALIATWFRRDRGRALTMLTFMGGFASVIFVPLTSWLVERDGWRSALVWLAAIYALLAIVPHAIVLRRRPRDIGLEPDGARRDELRAPPRAPGETHDVEASDASVETTDAVRSHAFRWLTIAFALSGITTTGVTVHLVPLLRERGFSPAFAGAAMGVLGLMALPGRLVFTPLGGRWPRARVTAFTFALGAIAIAVLLVSRSSLATWIFVALFGAGFGAITPARAALVAETFGVARYGEISGVLSFVLSLARAVAPVGASILYDVSHSGPVRAYDAVLVAWLVLALGSAVAVLVAGRGVTSRTRLQAPA
jgi:MFS family permease